MKCNKEMGNDAASNVSVFLVHISGGLKELNPPTLTFITLLVIYDCKYATLHDCDFRMFCMYNYCYCRIFAKIQI